MPAIVDSLPALYRPLLPPLALRVVPVESKATCEACAMCAGTSRGAVEAVDGVSRLFRVDTKCCTFEPRLPNYLVGALLADGRAELAEGRRRMRERLASKVGVGPLWLRPPAKYALLYNQARRAFGRAGSLRCSFYEPTAGACTIWPYREAVCSTFFCKYVAGADGHALWAGVKTYLSLVEQQLARKAVLELHREFIAAGRHRPDRTDTLSVADLDETAPPEADYAAAWGPWLGREEEFYVACHALVASYDASDVDRLLGLDGTLELASLERLHDAATRDALPPVLRFNPAATVQWLADGSVALAAYSEYDAVALPGEAYRLLVAFTGRDPVATVRARLREEHLADLDDEVLLVLYRHRVLCEP